jgi:hypothetical protein
MSMPAFRKNEQGKIEVARSWQSLVERKIQEAADAGVFDGLNGQGRRVDLPKNPYAGDAELSHQLLKNANCVPPWIDLGLEIDRDLAALDQRLDDARLKIASGLRQMARLDVGDAALARVRLRELRAKLCDELLTEVQRINSKILSYNLSLPNLTLEKFRLLREEQVARFNQRVPEIP